MLGLGKIIILDGEPSIYPHLVELLRFLGEFGLEIELFTNGTGVTDELARVLAEERMRVVVKMNSREAAVQDRLAGKKGAFAIIGQALEIADGCVSWSACGSMSIKSMSYGLGQTMTHFSFYSDCRRVRRRRLKLGGRRVAHFATASHWNLALLLVES